MASTAATLLAACGGTGGGQAGAELSPEEIASKWPAIGRFVTAEGARLHAWDEGEGQAVILLHGANGNLRDWTFDLAPILARQYRTIAFDRPGLGYSERPAGMTGDPAEQARLMSRAASEMGVRRPILVGHSLGAAVAMAWALEEPENVAGVVTVSGTVMPWSGQPMTAERLGLDEFLVGLYLGYMEASASSGGIERFVNRIFRPQKVPAGYTDYVGGPLSLRPSSIESTKQDIVALNRGLRRQAPAYPLVDVPVEVISGTEDFIVDPDRQPIPFSQRLPNAQLTLLEGVGHMAHHVAPEILLSSVDRLARTA